MSIELTGDHVDRLESAIRELVKVRVESQPTAKAADGGRYGEATDGSKAVADELAKVDEAKEDASRKAQKAAIADEVKAALADLRLPSLAQTIGPGPSTKQSQRDAESVIAAFPSLKAALGSEYQAGDFISAVAAVKNLGDGIDIERAQWGKAKLLELGAWYGSVPEKSQGYTAIGADGKATLGATGATGGYVLPNNLVDTVVKPSTQRAVLQNLVTVRNGVAVRGVDQPFRTGAPARATFQDWGATKENVNEAYGSYTANLGTIARIYDISKQYARFSAGSAEADIMDELTKGVILGENYYMIAGAGTGSVGSGDPTTGVYTALNARPGFKAAFASASTTTVAGSFASACSTLIQNVAANNREVSAIVVDHTTYFSASRQGADAAGFWVNPAGGPTGFNLSPTGSLRFWQVPIYYDTNLGTNAATKIAIGAQWDVFKLYRGMEFRVDSTDVAGNRWDTNLIGYRGEEEIGFHAGTGVEVGAAFLLTAVIP